MAGASDALRPSWKAITAVWSPRAAQLHGTRSTPAMLADAARAIADASRVIGEIDRTLARDRLEHRSARPDNGRPPPGMQIEHRLGRILSVH
jgi:hypothetical protein